MGSGQICGMRNKKLKVVFHAHENDKKNITQLEQIKSDMELVLQLIEQNSSPNATDNLFNKKCKKKMKTIITSLFLFVFLLSSNAILAQHLIVDHDSDAPTLSPHIALIEQGSDDFSRLWFQDKDDPSVRWAFLARPGHPTLKEIAMAYNGVPKWRLNNEGVMTINDAYSFPNTTGGSSRCLVMSKTVAGQLEWAYPRIMQSANGQAKVEFSTLDGVRLFADDTLTLVVDQSAVRVFADLKVGGPSQGLITIGDINFGTDALGHMAITSTFRPTGNGTHDLGTLANRWKRVFAVNGTIQTSDARLKKNIQEVPYGLSTVMEMKPVVYNWKEEANQDQKHIGFLAQDLLNQTPEVVFQDESIDQYGVKYAELIPVLVKAIQEQQAQIEAQALEIRKLQK